MYEQKDSNTTIRCILLTKNYNDKRRIIKLVGESERHRNLLSDHKIPNGLIKPSSKAAEAKTPLPVVQSRSTSDADR